MGEGGVSCWPSSVWWEVPSLCLLALVLLLHCPGVDIKFQPQNPISPVEMGWIFKSVLNTEGGRSEHFSV